MICVTPHVQRCENKYSSMVEISCRTLKPRSRNLAGTFFGHLCNPIFMLDFGSKFPPREKGSDVSWHSTKNLGISITLNAKKWDRRSYFDVRPKSSNYISMCNTVYKLFPLVHKNSTIWVMEPLSKDQLSIPLEGGAISLCVVFWWTTVVHRKPIAALFRRITLPI